MQNVDPRIGALVLTGLLMTMCLISISAGGPLGLIVGGAFFLGAAGAFSYYATYDTDNDTDCFTGCCAKNEEEEPLNCNENENKLKNKNADYLNEPPKGERTPATAQYQHGENKRNQFQYENIKNDTFEKYNDQSIIEIRDFTGPTIKNTLG